MELWSNVIALIVCSCFSCDGKMMKVIYCLIRYEPTGFFLKLYMSTNTTWSLFTLSQARAACGTQSFTRWLQLSLWGFTDWALRVEIGNEPLAGCKKPSPFSDGNRSFEHLWWFILLSDGCIIPQILPSNTKHCQYPFFYISNKVISCYLLVRNCLWNNYRELLFVGVWHAIHLENKAGGVLVKIVLNKPAYFVCSLHTMLLFYCWPVLKK